MSRKMSEIFTQAEVEQLLTAINAINDKVIFVTDGGHYKSNIIMVFRRFYGF